MHTTVGLRHAGRAPDCARLAAVLKRGQALSASSTTGTLFMILGPSLRSGNAMVVNDTTGRVQAEAGMVFSGWLPGRR